MFISIQKILNTNIWDYPGDISLFPNGFHNPDDDQEFVVENNSGKTPAELSIDAGYTITEYQGIDPLVYLTVEGDKAYNVMNLGETLNFTATFSDVKMNAVIPMAIVNRENIHVANAFVTIADGIGTGTFTPEKAIDYFVTDEAINFHSAVLGTTLELTTPFYIRVVQS